MTVQGLMYPEGDFAARLIYYLEGYESFCREISQEFYSFRKGEYDILAEMEFRV